jgi:flagellar protein FliJ
LKSRDALIRRKLFEVEEKCRKVAEIETTINKFNQMVAYLDRQIAIEQERAGVSDIAQAAIQRRNNLLTSAADLQVKLANAAAALDEAREEMRKIDLLEGRDAEQGEA